MQLFKRKAKSNTRVGVAVTADQLAIAHLEARADGPYLLDCVQFRLDSDSNLEQVLGKAVDDMALEGTSCSYVLSPADYSLQLIEAPNVEPGELRQAARWKVKDLLDMKIDDAAIDVFPVPDDAYRGRRMVYVAAARKSRIRRLAEQIAETDLELAVIDIPELCMKNIVNHCLDDTDGIAFMDLRRTGSTMNISHGGELYLTRRINTQIDPDVMRSSDWSSLRERLVLEIQRSLDYYETQMHKGAITRIVIAPRRHDSRDMARELDEALSQGVTALDLNDCIPGATALTAELQQIAVSAIGATLRGLKKAGQAAPPEPREQEAA